MDGPYEKDSQIDECWLILAQPTVESKLK